MPHAIVSSDPTEIHQVLMNLCTNAAQAVDESGGRIEVSLDDWHSGGGSSGAEQSPQYYYRLRVRDNGPGIDEDVIERIFDPFFTTKGVGEGTGMGLAVVHSIAEQLGGLVEAGNNEGGPGACMTVYLPTDGGGASAEGQKRAKPGGLPRGSERVLVVDDEPAIGRILERMLTGLGYKVTACTSSADALGKFTAAPGLFDIVITDQSMPDLSGTELLGRLRALREDIPVVVMTGFSRQLAEAGPGQLGLTPCWANRYRVTGWRTPSATCWMAAAVLPKRPRKGRPCFTGKKAGGHPTYPNRLPALPAAPGATLLLYAYHTTASCAVTCLAAGHEPGSTHEP